MGARQFLAASGAVLLTFLAGAELDPDVIRVKLTEVCVVELVGFAAPFLGCAAVAHYGLGVGGLGQLALRRRPLDYLHGRGLCGHAGNWFNQTEFGKGILRSCFINDFGA